MAGFWNKLFGGGEKEEAAPAPAPVGDPVEAPAESPAKSPAETPTGTQAVRRDARYVIVGAGPAGVIAAETLRKADPAGSVILLGGEAEPPYSRMAIPYLLTGKIGEDGTYLRKSDGYYAERGIDVIQGTARSVDVSGKRVGLAGGGSIGYERLLVASGSRAFRPPVPGLTLAGVENCWTLADARRIAERAESGSNVVLMGAGFIGCIILESLVERGVHLTVVEMEDRMVPRMMDATAGGLLKSWCESKGVRVLTSTRVDEVTEADGALSVRMNNGDHVSASLVVVAAGVRPNVEFLEGSGVETDAGVVTDEYMRSSVPDIYAAGDVAQGFDFSTGLKSVHAIQPTAADHGRIAALNMVGDGTGAPYKGSLGMNVLDTLGLISCSFGLWQGVEGGETAQSLDEDAYRYMRLQFKDDVLVGALSIGRTEHVGVLRGLIQARTRLGPWKQKLMADPNKIADAYVATSQV